MKEKVKVKEKVSRNMWKEESKGNYPGLMGLCLQWQSEMCALIVQSMQ